jgi:hypothetical protein
LRGQGGQAFYVFLAIEPTYRLDGTIFALETARRLARYAKPLLLRYLGRQQPKTVG